MCVFHTAPLMADYERSFTICLTEIHAKSKDLDSE